MLAANRTGAPLLQADCSRLPFPDGAFDGLVCGYALRNFTDLAGALKETARVLRPGGRVAILEVDAPRSTILRTGYDVWFNKVVPRPRRCLVGPRGLPTTCRGRWPTCRPRRSSAA